jgi:hypothetical protein
VWPRQVQYSRANRRVGVHPEAPWDLRETGLALPANSRIVRDEQRGLFVFGLSIFHGGGVQDVRIRRIDGERGNFSQRIRLGYNRFVRMVGFHPNAANRCRLGIEQLPSDAIIGASP